MTRRRFLPSVVCFLLTAFCLLPSALGQSSTATLSGTVEDERGAVIPGAAITLLNPSTALQREATTNDEGSFTLSLLQPGTYALTVRRDGFAPVEVQNVVLNVGDQKAIQIQLKAGDVNAAVTIEADASLVRTDGSVGTVVDRTFVENLPLNGRSFQSLILLTPGVTIVPTSVNNPGQFSVNGQRTNANYFTVDGVSANTGAFNTGLGQLSGQSQALTGAVPSVTAQGGTNGLVSVDALEEFKIQTSSYAAEFGRQPGGQMSLVTRSGKNQFQGVLFDYVRNDVFDANDWFANAAGKGRSPLRQNQFGGTFSGPVFFPNFGEGGSRLYNGRNRTFFFFSYEGLRLLLPQAFVGRVPSLRLRNNVASALVRPLLDQFPLPDGNELRTNTGQLSGFSPLTGVYSDPSSFDTTSIRIDHSFNTRLSLFGRYNHAPSRASTRDTSAFNHISELEINSQYLTLGSTWMVTPSISNELRFNMTWAKTSNFDRLDNFGGAIPLPQSATIPNLESKGPFTRAGVTVSLNGFGSSVFQGWQNNVDQEQINIVDNVSWRRGPHQFKFGVDYRRLSPVRNPNNYGQNLQFRSEPNIRDSVVGLFTNSASLSKHPVFENISFYGQDTWKVSPELTLDLGLRWDINPPPSNERFVAFDGLEHLPTATLAPEGTPIYETDYRTLAPRIGAAYLLSDKQGWERVVRGGFGVYYDINAVAGRGITGGVGVGVGFALQNVPFPINPSLTNLTVPTSITLPLTLRASAFAPDFRSPYTLQWNVSVQQSLGAAQTFTASYVAAAGRDLIILQTINRAVNGQRQNPNFNDIEYQSNKAASDYHSLQLQFQRRLSRGLQALVNYTWSHAIDEVSFDGILASNASLVDGSIELERGNADFDVRHNFSSALTYSIPSFGTKGFWNRVLKGWFVDGVMHAQSASPVDLFGGNFTLPDGNVITVRPDLVAGQPLYLNDSSVAGGIRFNPAAFSNAHVVGVNATRQGTLGRNVVRGLPLYQVDVALRRRFNLTERLNLQLKAEAFNLFNHPNFGGYGFNMISPSTFGAPSQMLGRSLGGLSALYQIGGPRSMQFSLRIGF